jgi:hypothetical protein
MSVLSIFFLGIISLFNITLWFYIILSNQNIIIFLYLTILNFTISTFYLTNRFIYEILAFINRKNNIKLEKIKNNFLFNFINNKLSKFSFTLCITVCKVFWLLILGGENLMIFPTNNLFYSFTGIYLHFCIGIFVLIDMFIINIDPKKEEFNKDLIIYSLILTIYSIILVSFAKNFDSCLIYPFLSLDYYKIIAINIVIFLNLKNSYEIYYFIFKVNNSKINSNIYSNSNGNNNSIIISKNKHKDSHETCDTDNYNNNYNYNFNHSESISNNEKLLINDFKKI